MGRHKSLWRGDLSPLGCVAAPEAQSPISLAHLSVSLGTASQSSGDKSPRHKSRFLTPPFRKN
ncbi:hypothetical protein C1C98_11370 [Pseudomonas ogarae]|uniref:Uncharacterized protein n=1 Tax=Pseudomonas ogarae (strain DSM 112162 / CECT 30235 / F113) TaxID=1114970 RepID=A0ABM6R8H2_PSEO1|nr:hypothetical protein C1C98_11370 [Pseudomonas ogarae]